jgi:hypothetical protein
MTDATIRLAFGIRDSEELDREELWAKALSGSLITPDEMDRM